MQKRILLLSLVLLSSLLLSCATKVPDVPVCFELSMSRGYCINTMSDKEYEVNDTVLLEGKTWWDARASMLLLPASSWAQIKTFIIQICKKSNQCDAQISNWERTVNSIDSKMP